MLKMSSAKPADAVAPVDQAISALPSEVLLAYPAIESASRSPCAFATLFPAERLVLRLADGREVALFVKHLGNEQAEHPDKQCRDREVRVYEELLGDPGLPVVRYHGSRRDRGSGYRELYLEYVDDWSLKYQDLGEWFEAARRLAHLHAHFAGRVRSLRRCDFLLNLHAGYFLRWARRGCGAVAGKSPGFAGPLHQILRRYPLVCRLLERQRATLVHNDLAPKNVIADRAASPARICIIDWELAGIGCGLLDLVHLKYGLDPASDREMVAVYRAELRGTDLLPADEGEFGRLLAACELHKTLYRLAHSPGWHLPVSTVGRWIAEATGFLKACER